MGDLNFGNENEEYPQNTPWPHPHPILSIWACLWCRGVLWCWQHLAHRGWVQSHLARGLRLHSRVGKWRIETKFLSHTFLDIPDCSSRHNVCELKLAPWWRKRQKEARNQSVKVSLCCTKRQYLVWTASCITQTKTSGNLSFLSSHTCGTIDLSVGCA